jgi:hypothetical protein
LKSDMRPNTAVLSKNCMAFFGLFANVTCLCLVFPCLRHPGPSCSPLTPIKGSTVVLRKSAENPVSTYPQARIAKNPPKPAPKGAGARNAKTRTRRVPIFKNPQGAGLKGAYIWENPHPQGAYFQKPAGRGFEGCPTRRETRTRRVRPPQKPAPAGCRPFAALTNKYQQKRRSKTRSENQARDEW